MDQLESRDATLKPKARKQTPLHWHRVEQSRSCSDRRDRIAPSPGGEDRRRRGAVAFRHLDVMASPRVVGIEATIPGGGQSAGASSPVTTASSSRSASLAIEASEK